MPSTRPTHKAWLQAPARPILPGLAAGLLGSAAQRWTGFRIDWLQAGPATQPMRNVELVLHRCHLQIEALVKRVPASYKTPMEEMVWLDSARWMLSWQTPIPEVRGAAPATRISGSAGDGPVMLASNGCTTVLTWASTLRT